MSTSFADLGVSPQLVARLRARGIESPSAIQRAAIQDALAGRDVCGCAPTGSGKTLVFALAIASRVMCPTPKRPSALVLVPTRELASQVHREIAGLLGGGNRHVMAVYGGTGYGPSRQALKRGVGTVVACPGRLEDLVAQGAIDLSTVSLVVLDEADRMVDMGFLPAVRRLLDLTANHRQMLLFSATLGKEVETLTRRYQSNPSRHNVRTEATSMDASHLFWRCEREQRIKLTADLVHQHGQALVFCRTRHGVDRLSRQLNTAGVRSVAIHGDRSQNQRERALAAFSRGEARALVATDVAARGIHVDNMPCVVHYDPPADPTDYLHRSGRTARAGKPGTVVSLVSREQEGANRSLQRSLGFAVGLGSSDAPHVVTIDSPMTIAKRDRRPAPHRGLNEGRAHRSGGHKEGRVARKSQRTATSRSTSSSPSKRSRNRMSNNAGAAARQR